ncbi:MAG TPA: XdhC family protein [Anaerohalosphaeraceae bacterium]|nr:XdhC family protein [Anaerohalosphaeraceae bacterium]HRT49635.1 XdhC family protein [Anaerohalosphaeraceae bacterium]HRT85430.1 XdhC family protein [Anaerohalosphaeraceae bacterium]
MADVSCGVAGTEVYKTAVALIDAGRAFALAVVLNAEGSTPARAGGKAIIEPDGRIHGTIGGGQVEAAVQQHAIEACRSGTACLFDFAFAGADASTDLPVCGGRMRILIEPNVTAGANAWRAAVESLRSRRRGVLLTRVTSGEQPHAEYEWLEDTARPPGPLGEQVDACICKESTVYLADTGQGAELIEPVIPPPTLIIAGGGHIGQALAIQAQLVGFDITVIDDRSEFTDPARFPAGVRTICGDIADLLARAQIGPDTYIVIVTRGHRHDAEALKACIHCPSGYVGMIGSKRKVAVLRADFIKAGIAAEAFDRVFAPIGLDIGAVTVPEIAAAIVAQLIAVRRRGRDAAGRIGGGS